MKGETGILLTLVILAFLSWAFFFYFCFRSPRNVQKNDRRFTTCLVVSWILFILFISLFIIIIIFEGLMEKNGKNARCQFAVVTSFIINGYLNNNNNNQYIGFENIKALITKT